jgi:6-phosphogluconolactonase (cycloisomerase 2 family)
MRTTWLALLVLAPAAAAGDTFVYVHNRDTESTVHAYRVDKDSGELTLVEGSPFGITDDGGGCGGLCQTMDSARIGKQRFLLTDGLLGVTPWLVAKDGTLTELPGNTAGGAGDWLGVTSVKKGGHVFVYANEFDNNQVHGFELDAAGVLTELADSPWPTGAGCDGIDSGKDLVVSINEDGISLSVFKVQKGGSLVEAPGSPVSFPTDFSFNVHVDKAGRHVYSADDDQDIFAFLADKKTGELTALDNSPFDCGLPGLGTGLAFGKKPMIVGVDSGVNDPADPALQFLKRQKSGQLVAKGEAQVAATASIDAQAISDDGRFLFVASDDGDQLESLRIFGSSGVIESKDTASVTLDSVNAIVVVKF